MFIIDQFQTTDEGGTKHDSSQETVRPSQKICHELKLREQIGGGGVYGTPKITFDISIHL
jgi:hypothetical protein